MYLVEYGPLKRNWKLQLRPVAESMVHHRPALEYPNANGFLYDHPVNDEKDEKDECLNFKQTRIFSFLL